MKKTTLAVAMFAAFGHAPASFAANWFQMQNYEAPGAPEYKFWGFIQPQYQHNLGGAAAGLTGAPGARAYNGQIPVLNLVGPDLTSKDQGQIFRFRPGLRGVMPGTDEKINYFLLAELGNNAITENGSVNGVYNKRMGVMTDATVSLNYIPGARVRLGLGRLPVGEEAMLGEYAMDYINFTNVTDGLLNERFVTPYAVPASAFAPAAGINMNGAKNQAGTLAGSVGAFRDTGVEVYDWFRKDMMEYNYAVMVSQGDGLNFNTANNPGNHDVTVRLQTSYLFGEGTGPKREDVTAYVWHQDGKRYFNGVNYDRLRQGVGLKYLHGPLRLGTEYIQGSGMIYMGPNPAFNQVMGGFVPVQLMAVESTNKASGYYLDAGWKFTEKLEVDLRFDSYDKMTNSLPDERRLNTWTIGGQYFYGPGLRFSLNYAYRTASVVNPGTAAAGPASIALNNAMNVLDATGNVFSAQMTYRW